MTAQKEQKQSFLEIETSSAIELAAFRETMRPIGSGPLGVMRIAYELCTRLAAAKGWDLDAVLIEAKAMQAARWAQQEIERNAERAARDAADLERRTNNYIKKHGHAPPTQADKASALAKLTPIERKALGL